jgi:hypothetical protein
VLQQLLCAAVAAADPAAQEVVGGMPFGVNLQVRGTHAWWLW